MKLEGIHCAGLYERSWREKMGGVDMVIFCYDSYMKFSIIKKNYNVFKSLVAGLVRWLRR